MVDDIATRRAKLLGLPAEPKKDDQSLELMESVTKAHATTAELAEALRETVMTLRSVTSEQQSAESSTVAALRAELAACQEMLKTECEARARLEGEVVALRAAAAAPAQPPVVAQTIDTAALISAFVAALPKPQQAPAQAPRAKFFNLETKDSMGNPRRVRVKPEY